MVARDSNDLTDEVLVSYFDLKVDVLAAAGKCGDWRCKELY